MNILKLSSAIKKAVTQGKNKQGVIADAIAKLAGYKSHHAIHGDVVITVKNNNRSKNNKQSTETVQLAKAIAWAYSVNEIDFDENLERTSGDLNLDYYLGLVYNPTQLLITLIEHEAIYLKLVEQAEEYHFNDNHDWKKTIPEVLPKQIQKALSIELLEADHPNLVFSSFYKDAVNLKLEVMRFLSQCTLTQLNKENVIAAYRCEATHFVKVDGMVIDDDVFSKEKVKWILVDMEDERYHLTRLIEESVNRSKVLTALKNDLAKLSSWSDKFIWENIEKNEYISPTLHPEKFNQICQEVLLANEKLKKEKSDKNDK